MKGRERERERTCLGLPFSRLAGLGSADEIFGKRSKRQSLGEKSRETTRAWSTGTDPWPNEEQTEDKGYRNNEAAAEATKEQRDSEFSSVAS